MLWSKYISSRELGEQFNYYAKIEAQDIESILKDVKGMFRMDGKYMKMLIPFDIEDDIFSFKVDNYGYSKIFECENISSCYRNILTNIGFAANGNDIIISKIHRDMSSVNGVGDFDSL